MTLHRQNKHNVQSVSETKSLKKKQLVGEIDDETLKDELEECKHFLGDTEIEKGRQRVTISPMEIGCTQFQPETRHSFRETQVCSNVEFCFLLCAQEYRRWNVSVLLCTRRQHFDGVIKTCGNQRSLEKNKEYNE